MVKYVVWKENLCGVKYKVTETLMFGERLNPASKQRLGSIQSECHRPEGWVNLEYIPSTGNTSCTLFFKRNAAWKVVFIFWEECR